MLPTLMKNALRTRMICATFAQTMCEEFAIDETLVDTAFSAGQTRPLWLQVTEESALLALIAVTFYVATHPKEIRRKETLYPLLDTNPTKTKHVARLVAAILSLVFIKNVQSAI